MEVLIQSVGRRGGGGGVGYTTDVIQRHSAPAQNPLTQKKMYIITKRKKKQANATSFRQLCASVCLLMFAGGGRRGIKRRAAAHSIRHRLIGTNTRVITLADKRARTKVPANKQLPSQLRRHVAAKEWICVYIGGKPIR